MPLELTNNLPNIINKLPMNVKINYEILTKSIKMFMYQNSIIDTYTLFEL